MPEDNKKTTNYFVEAKPEFKWEYFYRCVWRHVKKSGSFSIDNLSGVIYFNPDDLPVGYSLAATPFWENMDGIPISIMDDDGDNKHDELVEYPLTFDPEDDAEEYIAIVHAAWEGYKKKKQEEEKKAKEVYVVMAEVSGGITGRRVGPCKDVNGNIMYFTSREEADKKAVEYNHLMASATATFKYWGEYWSG